MKQSEIANLSLEVLREKIIQTKKNHNNLKMSHSISPISNPLEIKNIRRTFARLATELTKRELQKL